jgi:hypothetical protein
MTPKHGGTPLPHSPICLPREHSKAAAYVLVLEAALGRAGWSASQRRRIRALVRLWSFRAEGRDPQFEQYGSLGRAPGSTPPTSADATVAAWRRLVPHPPGGRKRRKVPSRVNEYYRDQDRYGTD